MELETINKLYLELSQITTATTAREILLQKQLAALAKSLFNKHYAQAPHYASGRIEWKPLNEPVSVITQIDNMAAGISDQLVEAQRNIERLRGVLEALADYVDERTGDNECRPLENARTVLIAMELERNKKTSESWNIIGRDDTPDQIDVAISAQKGPSNG